MGRALLASLIGAVIVFIWGFAAWTVLHVYDFALRPLPGHDPIVAVVSEQVKQPGAYRFPPLPENGAMTGMVRSPEQQAWEQQHRKGPIGLLLFRPKGANPQDPIVFARGFAIDFITALVLSTILMTTGLRTYTGRLLLVLGLSIFAALATHAVQWNWLYFPWQYSLALMTDVVMAWLFAGLVMAAIARPRQRQKSA
jgi:hypothetical protein